MTVHYLAPGWSGVWSACHTRRVTGPDDPAATSETAKVTCKLCMQTHLFRARRAADENRPL